MAQKPEHVGPDDVTLGPQGREGHVCTLLNLMLAPVAASCPEGHPLSVLLRGMKTFLCSVTMLNLCWRFSLSAEGKQTCTLAAPSCSQFEFNRKRSLHKDAKVETRLYRVSIPEEMWPKTQNHDVLEHWSWTRVTALAYAVSNSSLNHLFCANIKHSGWKYKAAQGL